jgi:hypothetical protein
METNVKRQPARQAEARQANRRLRRSRVDHDAYYRAERDADPYREADPPA